MSIGNNIKNCRRNKGITQQQLADSANISLSAIIKYENNQREPKTDMLIKIAKALDVSLIDLAYEDNIELEEKHRTKIHSEIPGPEKRLINESPSTQKYNDDNFEGENKLSELLKNDALQEDSNYDYEKLLFNEDLDNIYIFIQKILQLKYSNSVAASNDDIAMELLLNYCGSSTDKFSKAENNIIKNTILNYIKGMIEFKRMNK